MKYLSTVENVEQLVSLVRGLADPDVDVPIWWRGQSDAQWSLIPGAYRQDRDRSFEANVLLHFRRRARTRRPRCPKNSGIAEWLFLAQHFGLPTRLLDWSESPLIAAFFAVTGNPSADGALWALEPVWLNFEQLERSVLLSPLSTVTHEGINGSELDHQNGKFYARRLFEEAYDDGLPNTRGIFSMVPDEADARMQVQLTVFTIHGLIEPLETAFEAMVKKIIIPSTAKKTIANGLATMGIRLSNLFPDLDHLAEECSEMSFPRTPTNDDED